MANASADENASVNQPDPKRYARFKRWWSSMLPGMLPGMLPVPSKKPAQATYAETTHAETTQAKVQKPVSPAQPADLMQAEIAHLPTGQKLVSGRDFDVFYARARQIPIILREIGRAREITFRAVGEGTGKEADLDKHDLFYIHLFLWDRRERKVAGAYRMGLSDEILARHGKKGFYSHSCFKLRNGFFRKLGPSIELGRSFICQEYQRNPASLSLLWKGIGRFVSQNPRYSTLFGPVSMSDDYSALSKKLLVDFLTLASRSHPLCKHVKPRHPFHSEAKSAWSRSDLRKIASFNRISKLITTLEPDKKGAPVLFRQYLNMGGHIIKFSVDVNFCNSLDGLVVVDLRETEARALKRYMGEEGMDLFNRYHNLHKVAA